jgi:hypothetical protein
MGITKPTHVYIGRDKGGCCVMIISDFGDKHTGRAVGEAITDGLIIERVDWQTYAERVSLEPTFMRCGCPEPPEQLAMFGESGNGNN